MVLVNQGESALRIHDWIEHHSRRRPDKAAVVDCETGVETTYNLMHRQANSCAAYLSGKYRIVAGDRVAMLAQNCVEVFIIQAACARLRAIFLPLNWRLAQPELEYILSDATPKVLLSDKKFWPMAQALTSDQEQCTSIEIGACTHFQEQLEKDEVLEGLPQPTHSDIWHILYTSGTTGRPKGAMLTHGQSYLQAIAVGAEYGVTHESACLTYTPTFHVSGLFLFAHPMLLVGGTVHLMRQFDPSVCLKLMTDPQLGISHNLPIPTNLLMIRNLAEFEDAQFNGLIIGSGGSAVPLPLIEIFSERGAKIPQLWGMTELCGMSTSLPPEKALHKAGTCGPPLMNMEISVINKSGQHLQEPDSVGEIVARGPMVMPGYWGLSDQNDEYFLADGWFKTGDAGSIDSEGFITIVGRWKDMYISGGENVYPAEVEEVLYKLTEIDEVAVIGIPHEKWGETGRAFVVLKDGASISGSKIVEHCRVHVAGYKEPKSVVFMKELPHSANGKILKHELRVVAPETEYSHV